MIQLAQRNHLENLCEAVLRNPLQLLNSERNRAVASSER